MRVHVHLFYSLRMVDYRCPLLGCRARLDAGDCIPEPGKQPHLRQATLEMTRDGRLDMRIRLSLPPSVSLNLVVAHIFALCTFVRICS